jgi:tetratricopeptide (TPR) repeat protein
MWKQFSHWAENRVNELFFGDKGNALAHHSHGSHEKAIALYAKVIADEKTTNKDKADAYVQMAISHRELGHLTATIECYEGALRIERGLSAREQVRERANLGLQQSFLGEHKDAINNLTRVLEENSALSVKKQMRLADVALVHHARGKSSLLTGDYANAITDSKLAIDMGLISARNTSAAHCVAAEAYNALGNYSKAINYYIRAANHPTLDPDLKFVISQGMGNAYMSTKQDELGKAHLDVAAKTFDGLSDEHKAGVKRWERTLATVGESGPSNSAPSTSDSGRTSSPSPQRTRATLDDGAPSPPALPVAVNCRGSANSNPLRVFTTKSLPGEPDMPAAQTSSPSPASPRPDLSAPRTRSPSPVSVRQAK